jgi:hypothetical protein
LNLAFFVVGLALSSAVLVVRPAWNPLGQRFNDIVVLE